LLIGADFLQEYRLAANVKTNCLKYEIEGNVKECKVTNKVKAQLEPQESRRHGLTERADHDVTQTINLASVWTITRKFVAFVKRNRELYDETMEEEINCLDINGKKYGKGNASYMSKVLRENRNVVIEFNASYNKSQQDALFLKFILVKNSIYFGQIYCPSSGVSALYTQR
jgi:hypothetical protein